MGANGLAFQVTHAEQGGLNKVGINCIRAFPGRGIRVWGARTLSSDPEWRYINVRRLFNYISESIMEGTQWSVFEPNDEFLWLQLRNAASSFLTQDLAVGRAVRHLPGRGLLRQVRRRDQPARRDRGRAGRLRDRHRPGEAGRVRDLPPEPVHAAAAARKSPSSPSPSSLRARRARKQWLTRRQNPVKYWKIQADGLDTIGMFHQCGTAVMSLQAQEFKVWDEQGKPNPLPMGVQASFRDVQLSRGVDDGRALEVDLEDRPEGRDRRTPSRTSR